MADRIDMTNELKSLLKVQEEVFKSTKKQVNVTKKLNKEYRKGTTGVSHLRNQTRLLGATTDKTAGSFTKFQRTLSIFRSRLLVASFGVALVNRSLLGLLKTYGEQEKAEAQLGQALGFTSEKLQEKASALQSNTTFGDEEILKGMSLIAAYVKEEDQIARLTEVTLDLAAAKSIDLRTASDLVAKSVGSSTNALTRYGVEITGAVGSQQRLESTIKGLNKLYEGQAKILAGTVLGSIDQTTNAFGDLAERIGKDLAPVLVPLIQSFKSLAESLDSVKIASFIIALGSTILIAKTGASIVAGLAAAFTALKVSLAFVQLGGIGVVGVGLKAVLVPALLALKAALSL